MAVTVIVQVGVPVCPSATVAVQAVLLDGPFSVTRVVVRPLVVKPPPTIDLPAGHVAVTDFGVVVFGPSVAATSW
ncbi:MAG: hypothetical protein AB7O28_25275 [Vicinamibacterales bacterium]